MGEHPGVIFKDGPSGRRAALAFGPDVWQVIKALQEMDERSSGAIESTAEFLDLPETKVRIALHYYSAHPDEITAEIAEADQAAVEAEAAWHAEQRLLA